MYALAEEIVGGIANGSSSDSKQDTATDNDEHQPST